MEIDFEKKVFKINGVDFGNGTTDFFISFEAGGDFNVYMDAHTRVRFATYDLNGKKLTVAGQRRGCDSDNLLEYAGQLRVVL